MLLSVGLVEQGMNQTNIAMINFEGGFTVVGVIPQIGFFTAIDHPQSPRCIKGKRPWLGKGSQGHPFNTATLAIQTIDGLL